MGIDEHDAIAALARRIEHDLALAARPPTLEVTTGGPSPVVLHSDAAFAADSPAPVPEPCSTEIVVAYDADQLLLSFRARPGLEEQSVTMLDQVQDLVAEETGERWPWCRRHGVWVRPEHDGTSVRWVCPEGHTLSRVGELE